MTRRLESGGERQAGKRIVAEAISTIAQRSARMSSAVDRVDEADVVEPFGDGPAEGVIVGGRVQIEEHVDAVAL